MVTKKVGTDILHDLQKKAKKIDSDIPIKHYILFSKSGFTDELKKLQCGEIILVEAI